MVFILCVYNIYINTRMASEEPNSTISTQVLYYEPDQFI